VSFEPRVRTNPLRDGRIWTTALNQHKLDTTISSFEILGVAFMAERVESAAALTLALGSIALIVALLSV
jgi:hypothetical protein